MKKKDTCLTKIQDEQLAYLLQVSNKQARANVMINSQFKIQKILNIKLEEIKKINKSYSLRSFANKLEMSSGALSLIMNGKRKISKSKAIFLADKLSLTSDERTRFLSCFVVEEESKKEKVYSLYDHTNFIPENNWIVFAILNLIKLKKFVFTIENISKELNIDVDLANYITNKMFKLRLIKWTDDGRIVRTTRQIQTTDDKSNDHLKRIHLQNLKLAKDCLQNTPITIRDFTSMTFNLNDEQLPQIKKLIRKFQDDLCSLAEVCETNSVYKLNIQLIPLVKTKEEL